MTLKIGDKVRFLNSIGGGIIRGFQRNNIVLVEEPDGFETPVLATECVVIDDALQVRKVAQPEKTVVSEPEPPKQTKSKEVVEVPGGDVLNVVLAFLPDDLKKIQTCGYEAYFVNDSNYFLLFNYMSCENNAWKSRCHGVIEPNTQIFIEAFKKSQLNEIEKICMQIVAYKEGKNYAFKNTFSVELRLDTIQFYKLHCFTDNDYFDEAALIYPLVKNDIAYRNMFVNPDHLREAILSKENHQPKQQEKKRHDENKPIEVDLHINSLLETTSGMSNSDILNYQLDVVRKTCEAHKNEKGKKIIFIHGKGEGILRRAVLDELKQHYKKYTVQDASFREYGFGATQVTVR